MESSHASHLVSFQKVRSVKLLLCSEVVEEEEEPNSFKTNGVWMWDRKAVLSYFFNCETNKVEIGTQPC